MRFQFRILPKGLSQRQLLSILWPLGIMAVVIQCFVHLPLWGGQTSLMLMSKYNVYPAVQLLIALGADLNWKNHNGQTALFYALQDESGQIATLLVRAGTNVNEKDIDGCTALHCSVLWSGHLYRSEYLVKTLLNLGADIEATDRNGTTPLMYAVDAAPFPVIQTLLEHGANVNAQNLDGYSPLMWVAGTTVWPEHGNTKLIQILLDKGANPNLQRKDGRTALMDAASENHLEIVKLLLDRGATPVK